MASSSKSYDDRALTKGSDEVVPKPQIEIIVDGNSVFKPSMKTYFVDDYNKTKHKFDTKVMGTYCSCDTVVSTHTVCTCDTVATRMQGVKAQDVGFSQFYANPLYLNPAFAGSKVAPRISLAYRAQWPGLVSAFSSFSASYDQYIPDLHGGIGAILMSDKMGDHGMLSTNMLGAMYSFRFQLHEDIFINLALQASLVNMNLNWDPNIMRWPDQIDANCGWINLTSATAPDQTSVFYPDFAAGAMVYGPAWYAGFAAHHLSQPSQGFYSEDRVPIKFTAHGGGLINLAEEKRRQSSLGLGTPVISPNLIYQYQGGFHYFNYGLYLDWQPFLVGVWYRHGIENPDAFIFMVGAQHDHFKIGYSYDVTVSELSYNVLGAHEITLGILLPVPEQKHRVKAIRCPSF